MDRRRFLTTALIGTSAAGAAMLVPRSSARAGSASRPDETTLERVKLAMLSMQRYSWEQGVAAQALLEWGDMDTVVLMAKDAVLRQSEDGRLAVVSENHGVTDPAANGEAVLRAADLTGDAALSAGARKMLRYLMDSAPRTETGVIFHVDHEPQVWIDSTYMAPPFLAVAGEPREAVRQIEGMRKLLWNEDTKLFHHIWDEKKKTLHRKALWGVGNGWAAAGMARVIKALPSTMGKERERLVGHARATLDGCLAHQRPDGLFHDFLDDDSTFVETNLAQMLAYTSYRGVTGGWLEQRYIELAEQLRTAATGPDGES